MIALWVSTVYLMKQGTHKCNSLITSIPATFMEAVSITYILMADEGFKITRMIAYPIGIFISLTTFVVYLAFLFKEKKKVSN